MQKIYLTLCITFNIEGVLMVYYGVKTTQVNLKIIAPQILGKLYFTKRTMPTMQGLRVKSAWLVKRTRILLLVCERIPPLHRYQTWRFCKRANLTMYSLKNIQCLFCHRKINKEFVFGKYLITYSIEYLYSLWLAYTNYTG